VCDAAPSSRASPIWRAKNVGPGPGVRWTFYLDSGLAIWDTSASLAVAQPDRSQAASLWAIVRVLAIRVGL
jgi:hypothetical protein